MVLCFLDWYGQITAGWESFGGKNGGILSQGLCRGEVHGLIADDSEQGQNYFRYHSLFAYLRKCSEGVVWGNKSSDEQHLLNIVLKLHSYKGNVYQQDK